MKPIFLIVVFAASILALAGCVATEKSLQARGVSPLTQSELKTLWSRTRTVHVWSYDYKVWADGIYTADGVAKVNWGRGEDEGVWQIKADTFCTQYPQVREGQEKCFTMYQIGENQYELYGPDRSLDVAMSFTN